ncbi:Pre-mRNA-splicing factor SYF1 [Brachionus plicatilis]|uniref:Pre-mRNA-splicing factor SYF1 n=1 Tax=Brachionus plicatilis TaxID=10195 RepID=A0A3M7SC47_BRAPC|nr:Pre-mRNA-splicing factor SYF1 [Brachionus plicatilis]
MLFDEEDVAYEEDVIRNPYSLKSWFRYINHKTKFCSNWVSVYLVYERAIKQMPGSYKLWYNYLKLRRAHLKNKCINDPEYEEVNNAYDRALAYLNKMPRIWIDYCEFLLDQCLITRTRKACDRALRSLPITQHYRIWPIFLDLVESFDIPDTGVKVYKRYSKLKPEDVEDHANYLKKVGLVDECAQKYLFLLNNEDIHSKYGKTKHQLWHELCELLAKNPTKIKSIKVEPILRQGIQKYVDQVGQLWNSLASYYIGLGNFERARDIYEEGMTKVMTVRDFTQIFDAYSQFEENLISNLMEQANNEGLDDDDDLELEMRLARLEYLMDRRPLLLNKVLLRQNPHNVPEWLKRVSLYEDKPKDIIDTFTEAIRNVDPKQANGKYHQLWIEFAKFYEKNNQIHEAKYVFEKAIKSNYKHVDELANVWCEWIEMELRHDNAENALKLIQRACVVPKKKYDYFDPNEPVQNRLYKSLKLWSMYTDLEESLGTFDGVKKCYENIIDLRIATPQIIINYGIFLEENNYFEEAFRAYEKGIALFKWPVVYDIWLRYLTKFIARYGGSKLERLRDLFEQCLENIPQKFAKEIYLLYAKLEENHGLARRAIKIYERGTDAVLAEERYEMFNIYIQQVASMKGVTATREIFEKAIEVLPDDQVKEICMRYAEMERKLGEIDRARAIYVHCSQICDPKTNNKFWQTWKEFEIAHGNEDTVREMLRIKRSVQATFNVEFNFMAAQMVVPQSGKPGDAMKSLESAVEAEVQQVAKSKETLNNANIPKSKNSIQFVK